MLYLVHIQNEIQKTPGAKEIRKRKSYTLKLAEMKKLLIKENINIKQKSKHIIKNYYKLQATHL